MWLPAINVHIPGAGITPFNVMALTVAWWRVYRQRTIEIVEELNKK